MSGCDPKNQTTYKQRAEKDSILLQVLFPTTTPHHRLPCKACGILVSQIKDEPEILHWKYRVSTTGPPGTLHQCLIMEVPGTQTQSRRGKKERLCEGVTELTDGHEFAVTFRGW